MRRNRTWGLAGLGLVLLVLGAVALVLHRGAPAVVPVPIPGPSGSPGSAAWGVDAYSAPPGAIARLERAMGRSFGAYSVYVGLDAAEQYPTPLARDAMSRRALIYLNINASRRAGGAKTPFCWAAIARGTYDPMIDDWARAIIASGYQRMVITFEHEPNVQNEHQPKCAGDTPAGYRDAFHHVYRRMRADGVRFPFAFVPTVSTYRTGVVNQFAPAPSDYQVIGADVYNRVPAGQHHYHTAARALLPMYAWIRTHAPGKPVLIGEIGDTQDDPQSAHWIAEAIGVLRSHGNLLAVNWNVTSTPKGRYSPELKAQALSTWLEGAGLPFFRPEAAASP
jgi:hypothetical protein